MSWRVVQSTDPECRTKSERKTPETQRIELGGSRTHVNRVLERGKGGHVGDTIFKKMVYNFPQ